jgi:hypothetical protein
LQALESSGDTINKIYKNAQETAESQHRMVKSTHEHSERSQAIGFYSQFVEYARHNHSASIDGVHEAVATLATRPDAPHHGTFPTPPSIGTLSRENSAGGRSEWQRENSAGGRPEWQHDAQPRSYTWHDTPSDTRRYQEVNRRAGWQERGADQTFGGDPERTPCPTPLATAASSIAPSPPSPFEPVRVQDHGIFDGSCWIKSCVGSEVCDSVGQYLLDNYKNAEMVVDGVQYQYQLGLGWAPMQERRKVNWEGGWADKVDETYTTSTLNMETTVLLLKALFGENLGSSPWENIRARHTSQSIHDNAVGILTGVRKWFASETYSLTFALLRERS